MNATIEPYAIEHASFRARLLILTAGFPTETVEDVRQDLLLDYLRRLPKYDGTRGDHRGFVRGVMRNHTTVLIARRSRRVRHEVLSDDLLKSDSANSTDLLDMGGDDPTVALHLSMDVERVLRQLPYHLQNLAALVSYMPIAEICDTLGKSRSRIYQMIRELRNVFSGAGLEPRRAQPRLASARCNRTSANSAHQCAVGR
jgi:RNA polymerase sigma-70 factor (ECF subfamily)